MAILRTGWERITGAFKVLIGSAAAVGIAEIIKKYAADKGMDAGIELIKKLAKGKGLDNESIYGYILSACKLTTQERTLLIRTIEELRLGTDKEKEAANNFIILVAMDNDPEKKKCGDKWRGEAIIHGFIHRIAEFPTDTEKVQMIKDNIIHIGTDAEVKTKISAIQKWAIDAWENQLNPAIEKIGNGIHSFVGYVDRQYDERIARGFERDRRRRANPLNWINPFLWFEWFIDLR